MQSEDPKSIWCLFSVANMYDQPEHNLVAWWGEKPSLEVLAPLVIGPLAKAPDDQVVALVDIWRGGKEGAVVCDTRYHLGTVAEGRAL